MILSVALGSGHSRLTLTVEFVVTVAHVIITHHYLGAFHVNGLSFVRHNPWYVETSGCVAPLSSSTSADDDTDNDGHPPLDDHTSFDIDQLRAVSLINQTNLTSVMLILLMLAIYQFLKDYI